MPFKALNDREKLSSDFNEANDAFIDEVLAAFQSGQIPVGLVPTPLTRLAAEMPAEPIFWTITRE